MYKLLIADDDEIICKGISVCIDWNQYDIQVADTCLDGQSALDSIENEPPDIAIIDLNMPFINGLELAQILRERFSDIKVIMLTAYKEFEYAKKAVELHVFRYVTKPFQNQELETAVVDAKKLLEEEKIYQNEVKRNYLLIQSSYLSELLLYGRLPEKHRKLCNIKDSHSWFCISIVNSSSDCEAGQRNLLAEIGRFYRKDHHIHPFLYDGKILLLFEYDTLQESSDVHASIQALRLHFTAKNHDFQSGTGDVCQGLELVRLSFEKAMAEFETFCALQGKRPGEKELILQKALDFIEQNYRRADMSLNDVSDVVHISVSYLSALFKKYQHTSYSNYLNMVRMEKAKSLLEERDRKTYEVAFYVGFNSSQYFSSNFKKYTGMTPKEYRECKR